MRIEVAGAGAGKTSSMASRILAEKIPDGKIVFCVAFTNAAVRHIKSKLVKMNGLIPPKIRVSTIHSFLNTEIVQPYYHLLFGKRFSGISTVELPDDYKVRNARTNELERNGLLHQTKIPEKAKWVVDKKSKENAQAKGMRRRVIPLFQSYCHMFIVDEAQDIDQDVMGVLYALDRSGIPIELYGDPKQDIRGRCCFRQLISAFPDNVTYRRDCHRCPEQHLRLSNRLAPAGEQQSADEKTCVGSIRVFFESDSADGITQLIEREEYGLVYISKKNDRFDTHGNSWKGGCFESLRYELESGIREKYADELSDLDAKRNAYYVATQAASLLDSGHSTREVANLCVKSGAVDYDKRRYARIANALTHIAPSHSTGINVKSIEAVKGLEHDKCLFILTADLAPYLMGDKTEDNKMKHLLYVALTRSLNDLSILVTQEVEHRYSRNQIMSAINTSIDR